MPDSIINVHAHIREDDDLAARIKLWEQCKVVKVCCLAIEGHAGGRIVGNAGVLRAMRRYPDVIVGMGHVRQDESPDGPEKVEQLKEQGFVGLKFIGNVHPYDHESYYPVYAKAEQLGMPVLFHTGMLGGAKEKRGDMLLNSNNMRAFLLDAVAREFPDLRIMIAHTGYPFFEEGKNLIRHYENCYAELSGGSGKKFREMDILRAFAALPGADMSDPDENQALTYFAKLCFGTDNPPPTRWIPLCERVMDYFEIPGETRERFYWKNAVEFLGIDG